MSYLEVARRVLNEQTRESKNTAKETSEDPLPRCIECGHLITLDEPETWWGTERVHFTCGRRAWLRECRGEALPDDAPAGN
jgi:hypothetical protein